jgi:hypothetical protein
MKQRPLLETSIEPEPLVGNDGRRDWLLHSAGDFIGQGSATPGVR